MEKRFYITTPIYYVNDKPHIGHAYTTLLADVLARYHREAGTRVFFLTGLDEHGQKVEQAARDRGVSPQEHCDTMAPRFLDLWEKLHIQYDDFIRTTEERHVRVVQEVLQKVWDAGDIYLAEYEGLYSVSEERFITEKEAESGTFRDIKTLKEKNYFFRMGKFQDALLEHIHQHPDFIQPDHRRNEILGFLRQPLGDLCISRPKARMGWGIELPFDSDYVTYVWFDALLNYITAPGYGKSEDTFSTWWPTDYHLIGKDILTTHAVYWPTMLFSLGLPQPRTIFAHGWWLSGESKMSKSLGNVVNPLDLIDRYGVDPVRYYLMREMVLGQDASFTIESFIKRYNSDLANDFGNLLSRVSTLIQRNFDGIVPEPGPSQEAEKALQTAAAQLPADVTGQIQTMRLNEAIETTLQFIRSVNRYMESQAPWKQVKTDKEAAARTLYSAAEALRIGAVLLHPVMPNRTTTVLEALGTTSRDTAWGGVSPGARLKTVGSLFPRIDVKKETKPMTEKQAPEKAVAEKAVTENVISFDTFTRLELKTARVIAAEKVKGADRLLQLQLDDGKSRRQIVAGIALYYQPEDLIDKLIIIVANLKPATIRGVESNGMLLAAKQGDRLTLVTVDDDTIGPGADVN